MYSCSHCHHTFSSPTSLKYHTIHQVCQKLTDNRTCQLCGKSFTTRKRCQYHITNSVCARQGSSSTSDDSPTPDDLPSATVVKPKIQLKFKSTSGSKYADLSKDELITRLTIMESKYDTLKENPQTINNNQVVVCPTAYGQEDLQRVQQILGDICGSVIKHQTFNSIPTLFNKIHNSKQLPEYHNVYATSERSNFAMVSDGNTFKFRPKKNIIDQIIEDKRSILNQYIDQNGDRLGEKVLAKYERYQEQIDDDPEFRKNLELEIGGLLLDMKSVIADDEKTRQLLDRVDEGEFELPVEVAT